MAKQVSILTVINQLRPKVGIRKDTSLKEIAIEQLVSLMSRKQAEEVASLIANGILEHVCLGDRVAIPGVGSFYPTCSSTAVMKVGFRANKLGSTTLAKTFSGFIKNADNAGLSKAQYAELWISIRPGDTVLMK